MTAPTDYDGIFDMAGPAAERAKIAPVTSSQEQILRTHMAAQYALARGEMRQSRVRGAPRAALLRSACNHRRSAHTSLRRLATMAAHAKAAA